MNGESKRSDAGGRGLREGDDEDILPKEHYAGEDAGEEDGLW